MNTTMQQVSTAQHYAIDGCADVLDRIREQDVSITIYERDEQLKALKPLVQQLVRQEFNFKSIGTADEVLAELSQMLGTSKSNVLVADVNFALQRFVGITKTQQVRLMLATVQGDMCRRFHVDINDVRMLCTYHGPGTQWLTDDNVDIDALQSSDPNRPVALDERKICTAKTGAIVLLKGAMYPDENAKAIVHRSPVITTRGEQRLLLRVDTNETMNLWG